MCARIRVLCVCPLFYAYREYRARYRWTETVVWLTPCDWRSERRRMVLSSSQLTTGRASRALWQSIRSNARKFSSEENYGRDTLREPRRDVNARLLEIEAELADFARAGKSLLVQRARAALTPDEINYTMARCCFMRKKEKRGKRKHQRVSISTYGEENPRSARSSAICTNRRLF